VVDVTQWYSPVSGGIRTYLRAKAAWAAAAGRPHAAVVTGAAPGCETVGESPFEVVRGHTPTPRWGYRVALRSAPIIGALERLEPDVVVVHDPLAFPAAIGRWARAARVSLVMFCHSDLRLAAAGLPAAARRPAEAALGRVQRRAFRGRATVLAASEATRARVGPDGDSPMLVSPLGVDLGAFAAARPDPILRACLAGPGEVLLLYAGRLSPEKRVGLLPDVLARVAAPARLVVAGTGSAERALARRARRLGVAGRVRLLGHVPGRADLARLMATADCFVHPNPDEPFGLAPLEALAAGCRVVAPAGPGPEEVLGRRGAVLVAADGAGALADGVERALRLPPPRPSLGDLRWDHVFPREWSLYASLRAAA
jgi:alpha-1,6-mannosyltransferase